MDLKQSFANIQKWVKANPKKSAAIAVVLVVVIYFAIKRGSQGSGETSQAIQDPQGGQIDLNGMGTAAGAMPPVSSGAGSLGGGGSDQGQGQDYETSALPSPALDLGNYDPGNFTASPGISEFATTPIYSGNTASIISNAAQPAALTGHSVGGGLAKPSGITSIKPNAAIKGATRATSTGTKGGEQKQQPGRDQTPAQKLGKGRLYTGWINGVWYILGYPSMAKPSGVTSITPNAALQGVSKPTAASQAAGALNKTGNKSGAKKTQKAR